MAVVVKNGNGASSAFKVLDHFYQQLHRRAVGTLRTQMAKVTPPQGANGLVYYPVLIPFWLDKIY
jgi:hypothetical protein